ncbi:MAG: hypothetical protein RLZZ401_770, partial [Pseudomonadota bacterium]
AQYLIQPPLVVDCNTVAGILFQEQTKSEAEARISAKTLHAPYLLQVEITSVACKKHKQGQPELAIQGLFNFQHLDIELHECDPMETFGLAKRYNLSAYDAAYLWLAAELKCPLATFDEKLGKAAKEHLASLP